MMHFFCLDWSSSFFFASFFSGFYGSVMVSKGIGNPPKDMQRLLYLRIFFPIFETNRYVNVALLVIRLI
jgi:hypothetical protein